MSLCARSLRTTATEPSCTASKFRARVPFSSPATFECTTICTIGRASWLLDKLYYDDTFESVADYQPTMDDTCVTMTNIIDLVRQDLGKQTNTNQHKLQCPRKRAGAP